jgi:putative membrane protein
MQSAEKDAPMISTSARLLCLLSFGLAGSAFAQSPSNPPPPTPASTGAAMPYLQIAGESDVYEVTSSQIAVQRSQNPRVRAFASMLIDHHTKTTNVTLTQAKAAGLVPPPAVLGQGTRAQIDQLYAASPADFDRIYIAQQIPAHEQALAVQTAYAQTGDKAPLRSAAGGAIPIIKQHLEHARSLQSGL